jgi:hypothetical protein
MPLYTVCKGIVSKNCHFHDNVSLKDSCTDKAQYMTEVILEAGKFDLGIFMPTQNLYLYAIIFFYARREQKKLS